MAPPQASGTMLIVLCGLLAAIPGGTLVPLHSLSVHTHFLCVIRGFYPGKDMTEYSVPSKAMQSCSKASQTSIAGTRSATGASSFLKAGDAAVSRSEWNQAINLYGDAIAADGSAVLAYTKRAAAHSGLQNYKAALRDFNSALDLDTSSVSILLRRCRFAAAFQRHACSSSSSLAATMYAALQRCCCNRSPHLDAASTAPMELGWPIYKPIFSCDQGAAAARPVRLCRRGGGFPGGAGGQGQPQGRRNRAGWRGARHPGPGGGAHGQVGVAARHAAVGHDTD